MRDKSEFTLRKQKDFSRVYNRGKSLGNKFTVILYRRNKLGITRTGFVASKKVGNSVERNRARRLMKEAYRSLRDDVKDGYDIIFVARNTIKDRKEYEVRKVMEKSLKNCELLSSKQTQTDINK